MLSTLNAKESDPHDVFVIDPEVVLAARGDRAPPTPSADVNQASAPQSYVASSASAPSLDTSFRVTASDHIQLPSEPSPIAKWAKRAAMGFLFALLSAFAAAAWKHHGDTAKQMIANWIPQFSLLSSPPSGDSTAAAEQPAPAAVQTASTDPAVAQPDTPTQVQPQPAEAAAPTTAASVSPDSAQLLQSMAHDLATMGQQIQQLKATIEQLKAGQDQMARDMARNSEARNSEARVSAQAMQPRTAPPPRPVAAPVRRPKPPAYPPAQTAAAAPPLPPPPAPAPVQPLPEPQAQDGGPVVRPPMPVR
jgi:hypothetical protein